MGHEVIVVEVKLMRGRTLVSVNVNVVVDVYGGVEPVIGLVEDLVFVDLRDTAHSCQLEGGGTCVL